MKIAVSYFYQIRHFKSYMIPVSTACFDPKWYHTEDYGKYIDNRNVVNGFRCERLHPDNTCANLCKGIFNCSTKDPYSCEFLKKYRQQLNNLDFKSVMQELEDIASKVKDRLKFEEEPIIVLIVYETPVNPCSERSSLIEWFRNNGVEISELNYPMNKTNMLF